MKKLFAVLLVLASVSSFATTYRVVRDPKVMGYPLASQSNSSRVCKYLGYDRAQDESTLYEDDNGKVEALVMSRGADQAGELVWTDTIIKQLICIID